MSIETRVRRWGGSLVVRIPKSVAEAWGVRAGTALELAPRGDELVLRKRYDLAKLLSGVRPENQPELVDWGQPVGREIW